MTKTTSQTKENRLSPGEQIRRNAKALASVILPTGPFLCEEHRLASLFAVKAYELFTKLNEQYPQSMIVAF